LKSIGINSDQTSLVNGTTMTKRPQLKRKKKKKISLEVQFEDFKTNRTFIKKKK